MQNTFEQLFELNFKHNYFINYSPRGVIKIGPPILNESSLNIRLNQTKDVTRAFRQINSETHSSTSGEFSSFYIPIYFTDSFFYNYTDLDFLQGVLYFYSTDQAVNGLIQSGNSTHVNLKPSRFIYPLMLETFESLNSLVSISLNLPNGNAMELPLPVAPSQNGYPIDLTNEVEGKYELHFNFIDENDNITYVFFVSDNFYQKPPSAILECKFDLNRIESNNNIPTYTIWFQNRSAYWRYLIINKQNEEWVPEQINSILINNNTITFLKSEEQYQLANGDLVYSFISSHPIPFMEQYPWQFKLSFKENPNSILLPSANSNRLSILPLEEESINQDSVTFISENYVYI
jgi:hypothetical protein